MSWESKKTIRIGRDLFRDPWAEAEGGNHGLSETVSKQARTIRRLQHELYYQTFVLAPTHARADYHLRQMGLTIHSRGVYVLLASQRTGAHALLGAQINPGDRVLELEGWETAETRHAVKMMMLRSDTREEQLWWVRR